MSSRIPVAVVGATGLAGQQFLASLAGHPAFEVRKLAASGRSAGKKFADAVRDDKGATKWHCSRAAPDEHAGIPVEDSAALTTDGVRLVFSAVEADVAARARAALRRRRRSSRPPRVPLRARRPDLPPGRQLGSRPAPRRAAREGLEGLHLAQPELHHGRPRHHARAAHRRFGVTRVHMVSMQAVSGAGRSPGVSASTSSTTSSRTSPRRRRRSRGDQEDPRQARGRRDPPRRSRCPAPAPGSGCSRATPRCSSSWRRRRASRSQGRPGAVRSRDRGAATRRCRSTSSR